MWVHPGSLVLSEKVVSFLAERNINFNVSAKPMNIEDITSVLLDILLDIAEYRIERVDDIFIIHSWMPTQGYDAVVLYNRVENWITGWIFD